VLPPAAWLAERFLALDRFFSGLGRSVVRFRFLVVLLWIVAAVVSIKALPSMSSEVNNDNSQFLSSSAPSSKAGALAIPLLGNTAKDSQILVVASRSAGTLTAADQSTISHEVTAIGKVPLVLSVHEAADAGGQPGGGPAAGPGDRRAAVSPGGHRGD
jgi:putative drug exporter of the RND superfamily